MKQTLEFQVYANAWKNEAEYNNAFHGELTDLVNQDPLLKKHRDWVEQNQHGFGDRPFHWVWKMLVQQMPEIFTFLEIGVFKGQVISLIELVAEVTHRKAYITGISTLTNTADNRCQYPPGNYREWIVQIFNAFNLSLDRVVIVEGKSSDEAVVKKVAPLVFNMIYIDGGHNREDVLFDIQTYAPRVALGGYLIMDDSSNLLNIGTCWPGLEEVSQVVHEVLEPDPRFKHLFACGHLRVFQRINP